MRAGTSNPKGAGSEILAPSQCDVARSDVTPMHRRLTRLEAPGIGDALGGQRGILRAAMSPAPSGGRTVEPVGEEDLSLCAG